VTLKIAITFSDVTLCSLVEHTNILEEIYYLQLQGIRIRHLQSSLMMTNLTDNIIFQEWSIWWQTVKPGRVVSSSAYTRFIVPLLQLTRGWLLLP
jgi:hypothetical protein